MGYPTLCIEVDIHKLLFSALAQLDHMIDTLSQKPLPTSRRLASRRDAPVGPNGHWLSRLPAELKSTRQREKLVKILNQVRYEVADKWARFEFEPTLNRR